MNVEFLIQQIRTELDREPNQTDVVASVTDVLIRAGYDVRSEPNLETMKRILVGVTAASKEPAHAAC